MTEERLLGLDAVDAQAQTSRCFSAVRDDLGMCQAIPAVQAYVQEYAVEELAGLDVALAHELHEFRLVRRRE